jgi:hypothetical protein
MHRLTENREADLETRVFTYRTLIYLLDTVTNQFVLLEYAAV